MKRKLSGSDSTIIHKDTVYEKWEDDNGAKFFFPISKVEQEEPIVRWDGGKISWQSWVNICAYCERVSREEESECQLQLFYSDTERVFIPWAFPQEKKSGMTTKELNDHPDFAKQLHEIRSKGFYPFGTLHTHHKAGAFQSSVDSNDEKESEGFHVTLGKISEKDSYDIHSRFTAKKPGYEHPDTKELIPPSYFMMPVEWTDFIEPPDCVIADRLPSVLRKKILESLFLRPDVSSANDDLIKVWMENRIEDKTKTAAVSYYQHGVNVTNTKQHPWRRKGNWTTPPKSWLSGKEEQGKFPDWEGKTGTSAQGVDDFFKHNYANANVADPDVNEEYFKTMCGGEPSEAFGCHTGDPDLNNIISELLEFCELIEIDMETLLVLLVDGGRIKENTEMMALIQEDIEELFEEMSSEMKRHIGYADAIDALESYLSIENKSENQPKKKGKSAITKRKKLKHTLQSHKKPLLPG